MVNEPLSIRQIISRGGAVLQVNQKCIGGGVFPCISLTYSLCRWGFFHFRSLKGLVICLGFMFGCIDVETGRCSI